MRSVVESFHSGCAAVAVVYITGVHSFATTLAVAVLAGFVSAMLFYFTRSR